MKRYIYSNRKEIEMKNEININEMNNIYQKEIKITRMKEKIITPHDKRQDSFIIKKESNIAFVEIIHKKPRINKNLKEAKSKRKNDTLNDTFIIKDILPKSNNENENINNKNSINNNNNNIIEKISNNKLNNTVIIDSKTDIKINVEKKEKEKEKEDKKDINNENKAVEFNKEEENGLDYKNEENKKNREEEKLDNEKDNEKIDINSLRVEDLKNELKKRNVDIPKTAKKKDLQELLMNLDK